jgi:hypothetical protein
MFQIGKETNMFRIICGFALIFHGVGHLIGVFASWTPFKMGFSDQHWIISNGVSVSSVIGRVFGVVWLAAMVLSIAAGVGLLFRMEWWLPMAIWGSIFSAVAIVVWFRAFPSGSDVSALVFDIFVLVALLGPWSGRVAEFLQ